MGGGEGSTYFEFRPMGGALIRRGVLIDGGWSSNLLIYSNHSGQSQGTQSIQHTTVTKSNHTCNCTVLNLNTFYIEYM